MLRLPPRGLLPLFQQKRPAPTRKKLTKKNYIYIYLRGGFAGEVEEEDAQLPLFSLGSGAKQPQREGGSHRNRSAHSVPPPELDV
jgi:hypothetical protein